MMLGRSLIHRLRIGLLLLLFAGFSIINMLVPYKAEAAYVPVMTVEVTNSGTPGLVINLINYENTDYTFTAPNNTKIYGYYVYVTGDTTSWGGYVWLDSENMGAMLEAGDSRYGSGYSASSITLRGQGGIGKVTKWYALVYLSVDIPSGADLTAAKTAAEQAKTAAENAQNILNGTSNGGKSLAATYDQAAGAKTSADAAKTAAEAGQNVIKAVKNQVFNEIMYGAVANTGNYGDTTNKVNDWVSTVKGTDETTGKIYTEISGKFTTTGMKKIVVGGSLLLFKVIDSPTTGTPATVIFGE